MSALERVHAAADAHGWRLDGDRADGTLRRGRQRVEVTFRTDGTLRHASAPGAPFAGLPLERLLDHLAHPARAGGGRGRAHTAHVCRRCGLGVTRWGGRDKHVQGVAGSCRQAPDVVERAA